MARVKRKPATQSKRDAYGLVEADEQAPAQDPTLFGGTNPQEKAVPDAATAPADAGFGYEDITNAFKDWNPMRGGIGHAASTFADEIAIPGALMAAPEIVGVAGRMLGAGSARAGLDKNMLMHEIGKIGDEIDFSRLKGAIPGKGTVPRALQDRLAQLTQKLSQMSPGTSRGTAGVVRSANTLENANVTGIKDLSQLSGMGSTELEELIRNAIGVISPRAGKAVDLGKGAYSIIKKKMMGGP